MKKVAFQVAVARRAAKPRFVPVKKLDHIALNCVDAQPAIVPTGNNEFRKN